VTMATTYTSTTLDPAADAAFERGLRTARSRSAEHRLLIGSHWRPGRDEPFEEVNPANIDELLGSFASAADEDVADAVSAARRAQRDWARRPLAERVALLRRVGEGIAQRAGELAATLTLEVGKNRVESMGEVDEAVELIHYYGAQAADGFDLPLASARPAERNRSVMRPFGVFGVIAPFNFPLALVLGPTVAALLTGNAVVAKPAPTASRAAILLAETMLEAGLPAGTFNVVTGGDATGRALVAAPGVDGIVFTGSYAVGRRIAAQFLADAGFARPCIVEMGGKNPAIVMRAADLEKAAAGISRSAWGLSGQKCSACSRVLVEEAVHDELIGRLIAHAADWRPADPVEPECALGPVHTAAARDRFRRSVAAARRDGDVVLGGGYGHEGLRKLGHYVEPTIVTDLPADHRLIREELFVPLLAIERVRSLEAALARASDQTYGLTAGLFSEDATEVGAFLERIQAGTLFVNRAAGATSGGWPGQQSYAGWKGSGSTNRGGLGPRYVAQFLREQGTNIVKD
jgi:1-pyrroline-5-carboxylate dehydrogenase